MNKRWSRRQPAAALTAGEALNMPSPDVMERAAASYVAGLLAGEVPASCPEWLPVMLAQMVIAAMVTGYQLDGLDEDAARDATRFHLVGMAEGILN